MVLGDEDDDAGALQAQPVPIEEAAMERAMTSALNRQARDIRYPDYKTSDDFLEWLSGYQAKIQTAYNFDPIEENKIKEQVVKTISSKLTTGSALDAYNRLLPNEKTNYQTLVERLTEEFIDPHEKCKFNESIGYNVRKKGQSLKDFMQIVKRDISRYSDLPDEIFTRQGGAGSPNPEKVRQGVRRFRAGIRTAKGKKSKALSRQLKYHMIHTKELTWENALEAASRWELAIGEEDSGSPSSPSEAESDDEAVEAMDVKPKKGKKEKKKKEKEKSKEVETTVLASLSDQVSENQMKIKKLETAQERTTTTLDRTNLLLQQMSVKMDAGFSNINTQAVQRPAPQQQWGNQPQRSLTRQQQFLQQNPNFQRPKQWGQNNNNTNNNNNNRTTGTFQNRPRTVTWKGNLNQQVQGNYGFQRKTPTTFPGSTAQPQGNTVAAATNDEEEQEDNTETAEGEEGEENVVLPMSAFMALTTGAAIEVKDEDLVAAVEGINF